MVWITLPAIPNSSPPAARLAPMYHLKRIRSFGTLVFDWKDNGKALYNEFARIQEAAGSKLACLVDLDGNPKHKCSRFCRVFRFHDLRSAYATENAFRLPHTVLQRKMRHKSFTTTLRYIDLAERMRETAADVLAPNVRLRSVSAS
jgi:integrase